jgi:hypothetical protein
MEGERTVEIELRGVGFQHLLRRAEPCFGLLQGDALGHLDGKLETGSLLFLHIDEFHLLFHGGDRHEKDDSDSEQEIDPTPQEEGQPTPVGHVEPAEARGVETPKQCIEAIVLALPTTRTSGPFRVAVSREGHVDAERDENQCDEQRARQRDANGNRQTQKEELALTLDQGSRRENDDRRQGRHDNRESDLARSADAGIATPEALAVHAMNVLGYDYRVVDLGSGSLPTKGGLVPGMQL